LKTADRNENQSIESMRKYENQSNKNSQKNACVDLGNRCSIHLSYGSDELQNRTSNLFFKPSSQRVIPQIENEQDANEPWRAPPCYPLRRFPDSSYLNHRGWTPAATVIKTGTTGEDFCRFFGALGLLEEWGDVNCGRNKKGAL
jgi:hypothetical protein